MDKSEFIACYSQVTAIKLTSLGSCGGGGGGGETKVFVTVLLPLRKRHSEEEVFNGAGLF